MLGNGPGDLVRRENARVVADQETSRTRRPDGALRAVQAVDEIAEARGARARRQPQTQASGDIVDDADRAGRVRPLVAARHGRHLRTRAAGRRWRAAEIRPDRRLVAARDLDRGLGVMPIALGDQLFLAPRAGFGDDVLERFHLLGDEAASLLDHSHAGDRRLDGQRTEDPCEERNDERGAKPEKKGRRMDLHHGPPDLAWRLPAGLRGVCYVCVTARRNASRDGEKPSSPAPSDRLTSPRCASTMSLSHEVLEGGCQRCRDEP